MIDDEEAGTPQIRKPDLRKKYNKEALLGMFK